MFQTSCTGVVTMNRKWGLAPRACVAAAVLFPILLPACEVPDRDEATVRPLPSAALSGLAPDSLRERSLGDGAFYQFVWSARGPWAIHLVSAEIARCDLDLVVVPATGPDGATRGRVPIAEMVPAAPVVALAGVNGDFFRLDNGVPLGSEVTETTTRFSSRPALAWSRGGIPWIGVPAQIGDRMGFGFDTLAIGEASGGMQVIGGYPELLDAGHVAGDLGVTESPSFAAARHPRTAIGFDTDEGLLWLVVVDGRQTPRSAGMSLPELANLFLWLGVDEALNLDGGGSSAMLLGTQLVSRPSDAEGERSVGNSVWLVRDPGGCKSQG